MKYLLLISFAAICSCSNVNEPKPKENLKQIKQIKIENKRYFHIYLTWTNKLNGDNGESDFSCCTHGGFPSAKELKKYSDNFFKRECDYVFCNFFEFKTEQDYNNFNDIKKAEK